MRKAAHETLSRSAIEFFSRLLLSAHERVSAVSAEGAAAEARPKVKSNLQFTEMRPDEFETLIELAQAHHVIVRGLQAALKLPREDRSATQSEWAEGALEFEQARIGRAAYFLHAICTLFEECGMDALVIKSLDHWPDMGSDLDLYTNGAPDDVLRLMKTRFNARIAPRSWGDRLAAKWNFIVPGLPEAVEVHVGKLGQTGEQTALASSMIDRSTKILRGGYSFRVTSAQDRLILSALQRMYRHFYFRLCDVVDTVTLADAGSIDYGVLRSSAEKAGVWTGVATYLCIVSDYAMSYRGRGLALPQFVTGEAQFGGHEVHFERGYLRVPVLPQAMRLYGLQLAKVLGRGELKNGVRLSLLPWLATAALVGQKLTGSDKGIW
ncbi:MAG TPA: hypothetical protein VMA34_08610 [Terracidiphilus sp.]|nr:hypothetical protein [Terracidiphilus sp.]